MTPNPRPRPMSLRRRAVGAVLSIVLAVSAGAWAQGRATVSSPQEPGTLMPHFDLLTLTHEVQHAVFDCLWTIDGSGDYAPSLAAEVPTLENGGLSEDGTTYTVRLRDDVRWHDGEPFTSEDVRFTWQVITDPDLPIPSRAVWEDIASIETPDPQTAIVTFEDTNVAFLGAASSDACFIMPEHVLADADLVDGEFHRDPVGTGPFRVDTWSSGSFLRLTAFEDYWDGAPELDELVVRFDPGSSALRTGLQRGETDLALHVGAADVTFIEGLDPYDVQQAPDHAWWQFWINNDDPILEDVRVRRALIHGLDRALITETVMNDLVEPQHAMLPPSHWAFEPDVTRYPFDRQRANDLLEEADWIAEMDGIRRKDGERFELEILNIAGQAERRQVVQIAQDAWRYLGIDVTIREIDASSFPPTMADGDFQLAYGWFGESQEPIFNLWLGTNWQNYGNEEALDLLRRVPTVVDREERGELIREFQRLVAEDAAMIPLAPRPLLNAVHERLEGYAPTLSGSLHNVHEWTLR